jgi:Mg-chelatase subunit ChlD
MKPFWKGKYADIFRKMKDGTISVADDTEVELIIKPKTGFEKLTSKKPPEKLSGDPSGKEIQMEMEKNEPITENDPEGKGNAGQKNPDDIDKPPSWYLRRLDSILRDNTLKRFAGNKRSGELDNKHLYKFSTTGRCFADKDIISKKNYNIGLIVDFSGSMDCGNKIELATECAASFVRDFQGRANLEVMGFNRITTIIKPFGKKIPTTQFKTFAKDILAGKTWSGNTTKIWQDSNTGGNHDHFALMEMWQHLKKYNGRKLIVIMSDGQPACGCPEKCQKEQMEFHKRSLVWNETQRVIEERKRIESQNGIVLGLGITQDSYVEHIYKDYAVILKLPDMYEVLITLLSKTIKRGIGV